jgi:hypothetical protein
MKNNLLGEKYLSCSFYLYRFRKYVSYGFPIINVCNPGVHYETPCTLWNALYIKYCILQDMFIVKIRYSTAVDK